MPGIKFIATKKDFKLTKSYHRLYLQSKDMQIQHAIEQVCLINSLLRVVQITQTQYPFSSLLVIWGLYPMLDEQLQEAVNEKQSH